MGKASSPKTIGDSIYSMSEDGRLTILASGQHRVVHEPGEALEILQWLYVNRDVLLKAAYPADMPQWAVEGKTSSQDTEQFSLPPAWEQKQEPLP